MPMPHDRCSFEVVYRKNAEGLDVIEHVVVRTGLSDASVTLTIPQVYNLAQLLDIVQEVNERTLAEHNGRPSAIQPALPRGTPG
jgi:glutaredoxin-related protein